MKTKISNSIKSFLICGGLLTLTAACTHDFEDFNTDPDAPTPEEMSGDYASSASLLGNMIGAIVQGQENNFQMIDQMVGYEYGRMSSSKNAWGSDQYFATYNPGSGWTGITFDTTMPQFYTPFFMIRSLNGTESLIYYWADIIRVAATLRVSDTYGPVPFSKIGTGSDFAVAYDDVPDLLHALIDELDKCIEFLRSSGVTDNSLIFGNVDYIYGGNMTKWLKLANTVKLRIAMRLVNVEPAEARRIAEQCVADPAGLISEKADRAESTFLPGGNSFHKVSALWGEDRVSADITSYMNGYSDPRLPKYALPASNGLYVGARSGVFHYGSDFSNYSLPNVDRESKLLCISASESWFCRAEGALRGWNMGGTAKELYEKGVQVSFEEHDVQIGSYLSSKAVPADYTDFQNSRYNISAVSSVTPAYDENAPFEENLERIMVQKWLGNFPNGWETWADFRRTGYPNFFPVVDNMSTDGVTSSRGMRRLPFPQSEFNTNEANVKAAVQMLGGPDTGATDLWWAKKN